MIRVGFVGAGVRTRQLMSHIPKDRGVIVAVTDPWRRQLDAAYAEKRQEHAEQGGFDNIDRWNLYSSDVEMYDKEQLDCSFITSTDHTRTLLCCRAIQAGLDIFAEKALTAYIAEGRALVNFVRKSKQICQVGTQQRSMRLNQFGSALVREGKLGRVNLVLCRNFEMAVPIPEGLSEEPIPDGLDWCAWQGPTKYRPFNPQLLNWMRWSEYNSGMLTLLGAHAFDQIQHALGTDDTGPVEFWPLPQGEGRGGRVAARYANGVEVRFELEDTGPANGAVFRCERGNLEINRNRLVSNPPELIADAPEADPPEGPTWIAVPHINNFFDCMESRELPNADVEVGHRSVTICHLVRITRLLNRRLHWDPVAEQFVGDDEANGVVDRPRRAGYELPV